MKRRGTSMISEVVEGIRKKQFKEDDSSKKLKI